MRSSATVRRNAATSKAGSTTVRPPQLDQQEQLAVAAGDVEQRHRHEVAGGRTRRPVDVDHADRGLDVGEEVLVGGHRALGEAGGPARVEDRGQVAAAEVVDGERLARRAADRRGAARASAPESASTYSTSGAAKRVFTGTATAPASWMPKNASTQSTPLGSRIATRSPRATPPAAQPARDPGRAVPQLPVGQPLPADLDDRLAVGVRVDGRAEQRDQRRRTGRCSGRRPGRRGRCRSSRTGRGHGAAGPCPDRGAGHIVGQES